MTIEGSNSEPPLAKAANHEIVTLAVHLLGGATKPVDTEDVAVKANEIAPGRFTWRRHKDQISLDAVRKRLWDAKSPRKGFQYVLGSERDGWSLTETGLGFCVSFLEKSPALFQSRRPKNRKEERWSASERNRLLQSAAFIAFSEGKRAEVSLIDASGFFRLDEYVTGQARERKIVRIVNEFGDDLELGSAVTFFADLVRRDTSGN